MLSKIVKTIWGDISPEEIKKFSLLSGIFFLIVGTYWLLRPFKDTIFLRTVGKLYLPHVKIASALCMVVLVLIYSKMVDTFSRKKLTYLICSFYAVLFSIITFLINFSSFGFSDPVTHKLRLVGWISYVGIESFGTLVITLFWSFVASMVETDEARRGYPIIIFGAQFGSLLGAFLTTQAHIISITALMTGACLAIFSVPLTVSLFMRQYPSTPEIPQERKKNSTGPLEGLRLITTRPYLIGILAVSTLFEIISILLDIQMKLLADAAYDTPEKMLAFFGYFGFSTNLVSLLFALLGTSYFIRTFGLTKCLTMFPIFIGLVIGISWKFSGLWAIFGALVAIKGLSYALNNPCKEIMYIPTSTDIKFKAKSWIDVFGGRSSKGFGGFLATFFPSVASEFVIYSSLVSFAVIGIWIPAAVYVGRTNRRLVQEEKIIS